VYESITDLPKNVQDKYSERAQNAFLSAFNAVFKTTQDESRAFAAAEMAARKVESVAKEVVFQEAEWDTAYINDLPDSSFAYVEDGEKDADGRTTPRSKRHFPYKNAQGEVDLPHLRNALARAPQSPFGDNALPKLKAAAKSAGVGDYAEVEHLEEAEPWRFSLDGEFSEAPRYDDSKNVHTVPVTLIRPGLSKNKVYYSMPWLARFAEMMEGKKAYLDHEKKSEIKDRNSRSVKDVAGWYENVRQAEDGSVMGDLNLVETPMTEHVIKLAKANPSLVGLSINAKGKASRGKVDSKTAMIAETVERVYSTDIVTEAAAGGEMTRLVASVPLDIDNETETETRQGDNVTDDDKTLAEWLLAEGAEKMNRAKSDLDLAIYLAAEKDHALVGVESTRRWLAVESIPEKMRDTAAKLPTVEDIVKFAESLKSEPPDVQGDTPAPEPKPDEPKPGEEGYKPNFF
jgi:cation transport regulator ChaB